MGNILPLSSQSIDIVRLRNEARFAELRDKAIHSDQAQAHPKKKRHFTAPSLQGWRKKDRKSLKKLAKDFDKRKKSIGKIWAMIVFKRVALA